MMSPEFLAIFTQGQAHVNRLLDRQGYSPTACHALAVSPLWCALVAQVDTAALADDPEALKTAYRLAWAVATGPTIPSGGA